MRVFPATAFEMMLVTKLCAADSIDWVSWDALLSYSRSVWSAACRRFFEVLKPTVCCCESANKLSKLAHSIRLARLQIAQCVR